MSKIGGTALMALSVVLGLIGLVKWTSKDLSPSIVPHRRLREAYKADDLFNATDGAFGSYGWVYRPDWVSDVIKPQTLQPFYLMPFFFGGKLMLTVLVFGYSVTFKSKTRDLTGFMAIIPQVEQMLKPVASLAFVVIALNCYLVDIKVFLESNLAAETAWESLMIFGCIWVMSPNYVAASAVWNTLMLENPATLVGLEPRYSYIPYAFVPWFPGQVTWVPCMKHIYALILSPYFIPELLFHGLSCCTCCVVNWSTKCSCFLGLIKASVCCTACGCISAITFGIFTYARLEFLYYLDLIWPLIYQLFVQGWISLVCPFVLSFMYSGMLVVTSCGDFDYWPNLSNGMKGVADSLFFEKKSGAKDSEEPPLGYTPISPNAATSQDENNVTFKFGRRLYLAEDDKVKLKLLNAEMWQNDFDGVGCSCNEIQEDASQDLEDVKIALFGVTVNRMAQIAVMQIAVLFAARASIATDFDQFASAAYLTIMERSASQYFTYIGTLGEQARTEALNALWLLF